jgi:hypothetical protein
MEAGAALPTEFVYMPLVLGGMAAARELVLDREDVQQSVLALVQAKQARAELFADPELGEVNLMFDRLAAGFA